MTLRHYQIKNAMNKISQGGGRSEDCAMRAFRIKFLKRVYDATGHESIICQRVFEVTARDEDEAIDRAKTRFTDAESASAWWLRADRIEAEPLAENGGEPT